MTSTLAVVIGRFQPAHHFHVETLLARALQHDRVLVLLGSSKRARTWKDPLRWRERANLIEEAANDCGISLGGRVKFAPIKDFPYSNNRWVFQVQRLVEEAAEGATPVLVGVDKDASSFYLRLFPQWEADIFEAPPETRGYSATAIREAAYSGDWSKAEDFTPPTVRQRLTEWVESKQGSRLRAEWEAARRSRLVLAFRAEDGTLTEAPYAPTFHTVDSVVMWRGHVLLIRRRAMPGRGLWALPGGFLDPGEWIRAGAVRERQEESRVRFRHRGSMRTLHLHADWCKARHVFDHPGRSLRGRTITTGFLWVIPDEFEVETEAADDADRAQWFPLYDVLERMDYDLFEDHQAIVAHFALGAHA